VAALGEGRVRFRFDWLSLAIPGVLVATVTLAALTATHLGTGLVRLEFRRVGNALFETEVIAKGFAPRLHRGDRSSLT